MHLPNSTTIDAFSDERLSDAMLIATAQTWMDALMQASTDLDYPAHTAQWSQRAKASLNATQFVQVCRAYQSQKGYFGERRFLALLRRPHSILLLWSQQFSNIAGEYVAEMVLILEHGQLKIDHVWVRDEWQF